MRTLIRTSGAFGALALIACNSVIGNPPGELAPDDGGVLEDSPSPVVMVDAAIPFDAADATVTSLPVPDAGSDDDAALPPFDAGTIPACTIGQKMCNGACAEVTDPLFGCGATTCTTCALPHATPTCSGSGCSVASCETGYADCDQNPANGCETDLSQAAHCGSCNAKCGSTAPDCTPNGSTFTCATGCGGGTPTLCGSQCVSLTTSLDDCGACNNVCPAVTNGQASCNGHCGFTCAADFHACGAACASDISAATCGASCAPCPTGSNAVATCNGASCGLACQPHFANCNGVATDGCEVDLRTSGTSCGACGVSCDGQACVAGACAAPPPPDAGPPVPDASPPPPVDAGPPDAGADDAAPPPADAD